MYVLRNKETGVIVDPRIDKTFAIDPADLGYETWDDVLSQSHETNIVEDFEIVDYEVPDDSILFVGKNYKIAGYNGKYLLIGPVYDYMFDSFGELVEAHPNCAEAREAMFGKSEARQMVDDHPSAADLMTILDQTAYPSDQDWEREETTWTLDDGSKIRVCGNDVEVIDDRWF